MPGRSQELSALAEPGTIAHESFTAANVVDR
jgi:hypothetical protein